MDIRIASGVETDSIVNGTGLRAVVWTQGCRHHCRGCHNPESHDFLGGFITKTERINKEIAQLKFHQGVTFSGGDPMEQARACYEIGRFARGLGMDVWCYTGYTFEELVLKQDKGLDGVREFLGVIDVLVDGRFILEERSLSLPFRGSKNQRIIDVQKSLRVGRVVLADRFIREKESTAVYRDKFYGVVV